MGFKGLIGDQIARLWAISARAQLDAHRIALHRGARKFPPAHSVSFVAERLRDAGKPPTAGSSFNAPKVIDRPEMKW
jgi:hypothetical protein